MIDELQGSASHAQGSEGAVNVQDFFVHGSGGSGQNSHSPQEWVVSSEFVWMCIDCECLKLWMCMAKTPTKTMYGLWTYGLWTIYVLWKVVNVFCELCILLVNLYMWIVILWIVYFAVNWKVHKILFGGGYHEFSSAWLQADENTASYFRRQPPGPTKILPSYFRRPPPEPTKITFLFSSATEADVNS